MPGEKFPAMPLQGIVERKEPEVKKEPSPEDLELRIEQEERTLVIFQKYFELAGRLTSEQRAHIRAYMLENCGKQWGLIPISDNDDSYFSSAKRTSEGDIEVCVVFEGENWYPPDYNARGFKIDG